MTERMRESSALMSPSGARAIGGRYLAGEGDGVDGTPRPQGIKSRYHTVTLALWKEYISFKVMYDFLSREDAPLSDASTENTGTGISLEGSSPG